MKRRYLITCLVLLIAAPGMVGQKPIKVLEDSIRHGNYLYPGFNVTIPEASYDKALKSWVKKQETGTKSKVQTEHGEMTIFGATIKGVSTAPVNIYSQMMNEDTLTRLLVAIELKKDQYVEAATGDIQLTAAKSYLKEFAKDQYIDFIKGEISAEEKKLRDLNKELGSLQSNKNKAQKKARTKRNTVNDEQEKLLVKQNELSVLANEIIFKNNEMIAMPVGAGRDELTTQIKELEKRRKKLQKEIGKSENRISKAKSAINQADRSIPINEKEQSAMRVKIEEQQAEVQKYNDKLRTVRLY